MEEEVEWKREDLLTIVGLCQKVGIRQILRVKGPSVGGIFADLGAK